MSSFVWMIMSKLIPLILLLIWFFTCRHWWYLVILIPIAMFAFQLVSLINDDVKYFDEIEIYFVAPIIIVILGVLYTLRIRIFDRIHNIDLSEINKLLKNKKKSWWNRFR
ncbi:hypothetical protein [Aquimarina sp. 2201CG5-10]|uniref:hypothetical protein n=1 Tax=Aquimarina callyspongiae TaxID=3098150 RepID=UPI002AB37E64|nr:hypothetical protein [Aquimarina sp. 2201CG5-10]MDY8135709.1 hypothetical protein [Aquimarina sp. 2201CG5-10]